jgi:hypothetical protein
MQLSKYLTSFKASSTEGSKASPYSCHMEDKLICQIIDKQEKKSKMKHHFF